MSIASKRAIANAAVVAITPFNCPCGIIHDPSTQKYKRHFARYQKSVAPEPEKEVAAAVACPLPRCQRKQRTHAAGSQKLREHTAQAQTKVVTSAPAASPAPTSEQRKQTRREKRAARKAAKAGNKPEVVKQEKIYKEDPWGLTDDGHYIDLSEPDPVKRFILPRDFNEFCERYPKYIQRWVMKKTSKSIVDDDVMDWTQDLALHMRYLPKDSQYRQPGHNGRVKGCCDRVEVFDPVRMHGATPARFFNWVNRCLLNFYITVTKAKRKKPLHHLGNMSYGMMEEDQVGMADDEYIHGHSSIMSDGAEKLEKQTFNSVFIGEFYQFVSENDPSVIPVLDAISTTRTFNEAQEELRMRDNAFSRARKRIKVLTTAFLNRTEVPKQRKAYKRRALQEVIS